MAERQKHGFDYQDKKIKELDLIKEENYTGEFDAFKKKGNCKDIPYEFKCIKFGSSIDLGDYTKNSNRVEDFILIIGFWKGTVNNVVEEWCLKIDHTKWNNCCMFNKTKEMIDEMKNISNSYSDDAKWKIFMKKYKDLYGKQKISLRFKRDHKEQKRMQCAINNKIFYDYFIKEFNGKKTKS